jgi:hypothetical protein
MPVHFEVLKEIQHLPRTQIRKIQIADRRPTTKRTHHDSFGRLRAGATYAREMIGKEPT